MSNRLFCLTSCYPSPLFVSKFFPHFLTLSGSGWIQTLNLSMMSRLFNPHATGAQQLSLPLGSLTQIDVITSVNLFTVITSV
jgi:hypothetical protein